MPPGSRPSCPELGTAHTTSIDLFACLGRQILGSLIGHLALFLELEKAAFLLLLLLGFVFGSCIGLGYGSFPLAAAAGFFFDFHTDFLHRQHSDLDFGYRRFFQGAAATAWAIPGSGSFSGGCYCYCWVLLWVLLWVGSSWLGLIWSSRIAAFRLLLLLVLFPGLAALLLLLLLGLFPGLAAFLGAAIAIAGVCSGSALVLLWVCFGNSTWSWDSGLGLAWN